MCYKLKTYTAYIVTMDVLFAHDLLGHEVSDFRCVRSSRWPMARCTIKSLSRPAALDFRATWGLNQPKVVIYPSQLG